MLQLAIPLRSSASTNTAHLASTQSSWLMHLVVAADADVAASQQQATHGLISAYHQVSRQASPLTRATASG
jgi:hypothetical protein